MVEFCGDSTVRVAFDFGGQAESRAAPSAKISLAPIAEHQNKRRLARFAGPWEDDLASGTPDHSIDMLAEEDRLRAELYGLLASLLARSPSAEILERCSALSGDSSQLGRAFSTLADAAKRFDADQVADEFQNLFIGLGRGELLPFGSYYLTGFLNEKPLAKLREDMAALGIARADDVSEPEDGIASVCEMMAGLIDGRFGAPVSLDGQRQFFSRHVEPWAGHFFADLEGAKNSAFYKPVGTIGRLFMEIEREAFRMESGHMESGG